MAGKSESKGLRLVRSERLQHRSYDLLESEDGAPDIYVDGFGGQALSNAVSRIELFVIRDPKMEGDTLVEQRIIKHRLIMPTAVYVEMCAKTLGTFRKNEELIDNMAKDFREKVSRYVSVIDPSFDPDN